MVQLYKRNDYQILFSGEGSKEVRNMKDEERREEILDKMKYDVGVIHQRSANMMIKGKQCETKKVTAKFEEENSSSQFSNRFCSLLHIIPKLALINYE